MGTLLYIARRQITVCIQVSVENEVEREFKRVPVAKQYRVIDFHNKYYNKWFMSKIPDKKWKKDAHFKLKVRARNAIQEHRNVDLHITAYTFYP